MEKEEARLRSARRKMNGPAPADWQAWLSDLVEELRDLARQPPMFGDLMGGRLSDLVKRTVDLLRPESHVPRGNEEECLRELEEHCRRRAHVTGKSFEENIREALRKLDSLRGVEEPMASEAETTSPDREQLFTAFQRDLLLIGKCPFCRKEIKGWHGYAGQEHATMMRERGLDPVTGHAESCPRKEIRL